MHTKHLRMLTHGQFLDELNIVLIGALGRSMVGTAGRELVLGISYKLLGIEGGQYVD